MPAGLPKRTEIADALSRLAPRIPKHEFEATVDHAMASKGLNRASAETALPGYPSSLTCGTPSPSTTICWRKVMTMKAPGFLWPLTLMPS
jgi:hypothetical protein